MLSRRRHPGDRYHALELLDDALNLATDIGMVRLERQATELQVNLVTQLGRMTGTGSTDHADYPAENSLQEPTSQISQYSEIPAESIIEYCEVSE